MTAPIFSTRAVAALLGIGSISFLAAMALIVFGEDILPTSTVGANAFSRSAIGHKALVETLGKLGIPVLVSRDDSLLRAGPADLVVIAEPPEDMADDSYFAELLEADHALLVLPKWRAAPQLGNRSWAGEVARPSRSEVESILHAAVPDADVVQLDAPVAWPANEYGAPPLIDAPQLIRSDRVIPVISDDRGILLGRVLVTRSDGDLTRLWILSDPDLLSNYGLRRGKNAQLAVGLIDQLRGGTGSVIVDEAIHGFRRDPNLWRALFEFPFIIVTINGLAAIAVLVWAATGRFGAPLPESPPLKAGKVTLIDNAAAMLRHGGYLRDILARYQGVTLAEVARRLHAPVGLAGAALADWLDRIAAARQVGLRCGALQREFDSFAQGGQPDRRGMLLAAQRLHQWKQEMLHEPGGHSIGQRTSEGRGTQGRRRSGAGD
jgi:hypothetical protein